MRNSMQGTTHAHRMAGRRNLDAPMGANGKAKTKNGNVNTTGTKSQQARNRTAAPPRYGEQRDGGGRHVQLGGRRDERRETD